ncbi:MAG: hypothetical protein SFT92_03520 [Rickettsiales bacterium]|nr:hypothetical protein [Rickettsiales bacterium]
MAQSALPQGVLQTIQGQVIEVDFSDAAVDGPIKITVQSDGGQLVTVLVGVFPPPPSDAKDANQLKAGDWVEAQGYVVSGRMLMQAPSDYIRLISRKSP